MTTPRAPRLLALSLGLLLAGHLGALAWRQAPHYDESVYRAIGRNILRTGVPYRDSVPRTVFTNSPPLGLYVNAGLMAITGDRLPVTRCVSVVFWCSLLFLLLRVLARDGLGSGGLVTSLALLTLVPLFAQEILTVEVDLPLIVCTVACVVAWIRWAMDHGEPGHGRRVLLLGAALAFSGLVKYSALLLGPVLAADAVILGRGRGVPWRRILGEIVALAAPSVLGLLLWYGIARIGGIDLLATFGSLADRLQGDRTTPVTPIPLTWYAINSAVAVGPVVLLLSLFGVFRLLRPGTPGREALVRVLMAVLLLLVFFALVSPEARKIRYQDPALPLLALLASLPLAGLAWRRRDELLVLGLGLTLAAAVHLLRDVRPRAISPLGIALTSAVLLATLAWLLLVRHHPKFRDRPVLAWAPILAVAIAYAALWSPFLRGKELEGWYRARDAGLLVARSTAADCRIAVSSPDIAYDADREAYIVDPETRTDGTLARDDVAAAIVTRGWIRKHRYREAVERVFAEHFTLALETTGGIRVYLRR